MNMSSFKLKSAMRCAAVVAGIATASVSWGDVTLPNTSTIADIQAAIDAAQPGDVITLEDGTYNFDQTLTVSKGVTLTGSHRDKCLLVGDSATPLDSALTIDNADACVKNVTISNITSKTDFNYYAVGVRIKAGLLTQSRVTGCKTTAMNRTAGVSLESTVGGQTDAAFMTYCMIDHNSATGKNDIGGVMFLNNKNGGTMANCLVWANSGYNAGGVGVSSVNAWQPVKIVNCTIAGNTATAQGGGLNLSAAYVSATYGPWVVNTIIAGNTATEGGDIYFGSDNNKNLTGYNCLCPTVTYGANPQKGDPLFVDADNGDFHLKPGSPARNKGDNAKAASVLGLESLEGMKDFYGLDRVLEDVVDIGCSEFMVDPTQPTCVITKDKEAYVTGDDVTLTAVADGFGTADDIVYSWSVLREGEVAPLVTNGVKIVLKSLDFGSYTADVTASSEKLGKSAEALPLTFIVLPKTLYVTSGENPGAALPYGTPETAATSIADALAVAVEGATIVLDAGTHNVSETVEIPAHIAISGEGWGKTTIYATKAFDPVVRINGEDAKLSGVTVAHGRMKTDWTSSAVGVVIGSEGGTLADCRVTDCCAGAGNAWRAFGAVHISGSEALVTRCLIDGNEVTTTQSACGGIYATAGRIENCVITNNVSSASEYLTAHKGAGLDLNGAVTVLNCTVLDNRIIEGKDGSGVHVINSNARVRNCIIDGNKNGDNTESNYRGNGASFSYCLSSDEAPTGSTGCIVGRPVFDANKPLYLAHLSPGQGQGSADGYEDRLLTATDFFGQPRVKRMNKGVADIDIGATETSVSGILFFLR